MVNPIQVKLKNNEVVLGLMLHYPAAGIIECMSAGWDWLWIDGQHGQIDYSNMLQCVRAADLRGIPAIPRVSGHEYGAIGLIMDMRTAGIMVPMVDSPQQAERLVEAVRFPPLGERSYGGRRVIDAEGRGYYEKANDETLLVLQIETLKAVENAEAIAATAGVDALFFGADDMKVRMGIPINTPISESEELAAAMKTTIKSAQNAGKVAGCVAPDASSIARAKSLGYQLIAGGGDVAFLRTASAEKLKELRNAVASSEKAG